MNRTTRPRHAAVGIRVLGVAGGSAAVLAATAARLPSVPWRSPERLVAWADRQSPALTAVALLHSIATALAVLTAALGMLHLLAAVAPGRAGWLAAEVTRRLTPAFVRIGLGLSVAGVAAALPGAAVASAETAQQTPDPTRTPTDPATVTMTHLGPGAETQAPAAPLAAARWIVAPGEHLWGIAEETLADDLGRSPTDAEIAPYWLRVIEANRDRLVHPDDPDLILPGQELVLPPVGPGPISSGTGAGS